MPTKMWIRLIIVWMFLGPFIIVPLKWWVYVSETGREVSYLNLLVYLNQNQVKSIYTITDREISGVIDNNPNTHYYIKHRYYDFFTQFPTLAEAKTVKDIVEKNTSIKKNVPRLKSSWSHYFPWLSWIALLPVLAFQVRRRNILKN